MPTLCKECAKDPDLVSLIVEIGVRVERCSICKTQDVLALDSNDKNLIAMIRALIRKHFNEWDYNTHWGGEGIGYIFQRENPILNFAESWSSVEIEDATLPSFEEGYETVDVPISLFAGHGQNGHRNMPLEAISVGNEQRFDGLLRRARKKNHYLLEPEAKSLIDPHIGALKKQVKSATTLHRARVGYAKRDHEGFDSAGVYTPYEGATLGAPQPAIAGGGRMNRPGVAFFYAASNEETALCEVRPHPGQVVSVGSFKSVRNLVVADFSSVSIKDYFMSDERLNDYWALMSIDRLFSIPMPPEERGDYVTSQLLADVVRQLGFDGVVFNSSVGAGLNYAFFDSSAFEYVENSASTVYISRLVYEYHKLKS